MISFSLFGQLVALNGWILGAAFVVLVLFYFLYKNLSHKELPKIYFSAIALFKNVSPDRTFVLDDRRVFCLLLFVLTAAFAMSNPRILEEGQKKKSEKLATLPKEGIALYLVLDRSSSMERKIPSFSGGSTTLIELLKETTKEFVQERSDDLLGLVSFARIPEVVVPLTFEKGALYEGVDKLHVVTNRKEEDGTAIGYAIYKTAHLINAVDELKKNQGAYEIHHNAIVLVTDGLQSTHPEDLGHSNRSISLDDAALYAREKSVRLYIVNLFPDIHQERYAPELRQLQRVTGMTGGRFFSIANPYLLSNVYQEIDEIETSEFPVKVAGKVREENQVKYYLYPLLIGWALLFLVLYLIVDYVIYLRIP